eukprot:jgi/Mesen1/5910/ME000030S05172
MLGYYAIQPCGYPQPVHANVSQPYWLGDGGASGRNQHQVQDALSERTVSALRSASSTPSYIPMSTTPYGEVASGVGTSSPASFRAGASSSTSGKGTPEGSTSGGNLEWQTHHPTLQSRTHSLTSTGGGAVPSDLQTPESQQQANLAEEFSQVHIDAKGSKEDLPDAIKEGESTQTGDLTHWMEEHRSQLARASTLALQELAAHVREIKNLSALSTSDSEEPAGTREHNDVSLSTPSPTSIRALLEKLKGSQFAKEVDPGALQRLITASLAAQALTSQAGTPSSNGGLPRDAQVFPAAIVASRDLGASSISAEEVLYKQTSLPIDASGSSQPAGIERASFAGVSEPLKEATKDGDTEEPKQVFNDFQGEDREALESLLSGSMVSADEKTMLQLLAQAQTLAHQQSLGPGLDPFAQPPARGASGFLGMHDSLFRLDSSYRMESFNIADLLVDPNPEEQQGDVMFGAGGGQGGDEGRLEGAREHVWGSQGHPGDTTVGERQPSACTIAELCADPLSPVVTEPKTQPSEGPSNSPWDYRLPALMESSSPPIAPVDNILSEILSLEEGIPDTAGAMDVTSALPDEGLQVDPLANQEALLNQPLFIPHGGGQGLEQGLASSPLESSLVFSSAKGGGGLQAVPKKKGVAPGSSFETNKAWQAVARARLRSEMSLEAAGPREPINRGQRAPHKRAKSFLGGRQQQAAEPPGPPPPPEPAVSSPTEAPNFVRSVSAGEHSWHMRSKLQGGILHSQNSGILHAEVAELGRELSGSDVVSSAEEESPSVSQANEGWGGGFDFRGASSSADEGPVPMELGMIRRVVGKCQELQAAGISLEEGTYGRGRVARRLGRGGVRLSEGQLLASSMRRKKIKQRLVDICLQAPKASPNERSALVDEALTYMRMLEKEVQDLKLQLGISSENESSGSDDTEGGGGTAHRDAGGSEERRAVQSYTPGGNWNV